MIGTDNVIQYLFLSKWGSVNITQSALNTDSSSFPRFQGAEWLNSLHQPLAEVKVFQFVNKDIYKMTPIGRTKSNSFCQRNSCQT